MSSLKSKVKKVKVVKKKIENEILKIQNITEGNTNMVAADAKNILCEVIKMQAPKIILIHNHPSGNLVPSQSDIVFTKKIKNASEILGIQMLDHIIITENGYTSILYEMNKI